MRIQIKTISDFLWGTINTLESISLPRGASSRSLNWITEGDKVSLKRGSGILGNEITGSGKITQTFKAVLTDGKEILFRTRAKKLEYLKKTEAAANTGVTSPGTMADDDSVGTVAWGGPVNAKVSDDSDTGMVLDDNLTSHYLKATNFGFSIPSGATINGIKVEIEQAWAGAGPATENSIKIVKGGSILGNEKSTGADTTETDTYITYGSSSDLWGVSFGADDINGSGFGVVYSVINDNTGGIIVPQVDHIRITVYYTTTNLWVEIGTNILGSDAEGKDISFAVHKSLGGDQLYINSPYGPFLKIMLANPDSSADMYDASINYKGYIKISQNRIWLWGRLESPSTVYVGYIDDVVEQKTDVTTEALGSGDDSEKTFAGTLAFKSGGSKRTCFGVSITDGTETFTDNDRNGTLTGSLGGTGTINYMTGAFSVTFNTAPSSGSNNITGDYSWIDDTADSLCDFQWTTPTRVAGEGTFFPQNEGGILQNIFSYGNEEYCVHERKTWVITMTRDDTSAVNEVYREKLGMPNWQAGVATADGIYIIDTSDKKDYQIKVIAINRLSALVEPRSISQQLLYKKKRVGIDLSSYLFDKAVGWEWGNYILFACRTSISTQNNRVLLYDKHLRSIDVLDYLVSSFAEYGGTLVSGDSYGKNIFTLFSGFDDDESLIDNFWEGNKDDLDWPGINGVKKLKIKGEIGPEQVIEVLASIDNGANVHIGWIEGDGSYVDRGLSVNVGALTIGSKEVGGGGSGVSAYNYERVLDFKQGRFGTAKIRFQAIGLGYASVSEYKFWDVRNKSQKSPEKYR